MNILTRKDYLTKNNIVSSAMSVNINAPYFVDTINIIVTILLDDLMNINYWTIPSSYLSNHTKDYKLTDTHVELRSMEILDVAKGNEFIKVATLTYQGTVEYDRSSFYISHSNRINK